jgi:hypothetical protein
MFSGPNALFISGRKSIVILSKIIVFWASRGEIYLYSGGKVLINARCLRCLGGVIELDFEESRKDVEPFQTYSPVIAPRCSN